MTVKAEMKRDPASRTLYLAFEASRPEDHEVVDAVRTAMFGDFHKEAGYVNSNRLVVKIKVSPEEAASWPEAQEQQ